MFTYTYTSRQATEEKESENKQTRKETRKPFWLNNAIDFIKGVVDIRNHFSSGLRKGNRSGMETNRNLFGLRL